MVSLLYGFLSAALVTLRPSLGVALAPDRTVIGTRLGMTFFVVGISMLIGSPVAGAIVRRYGFTPAWIWAAATSIATAFCFIWSRGLYGGWSLKTKLELGTL